MNDQYYTREPASASRPAECAFTFRGTDLRFRTDAGVFSRGELDLGCGWGAIGVSVARTMPETRVTMADVNLRALALAAENAARCGAVCETLESDGFAGLAGRVFDAVITNPPIRAGKQVIYRMFADAREHLRPGGALWLVIRKQQGAESCIRYLESEGYTVEKRDRSGGFWVLRAEPGA